jgi:hypothetical protein
VANKTGPQEALGSEWVEVAEETLSLRKGDVLEGVYLVTETTQIEGRDVQRHVIGRDGQPDAILLGSPVLDRKLGRVAPGSIVRIECADVRKTGQGREMRDFRVWVRRG